MATIQDDLNYSHLYKLTKDLDQITDNLIKEHLGDIKQPPIAIESIINKMGINIERVTMQDNKQSGAIIITSDDICTIYINSSNHPLRQRFTLAHELGHYISYKKRHKTNCSRIDYIDNTFDVFEANDYESNLKLNAARRSPNSENGTDPEEVFANKFAAAILMPKTMIDEMKKNFSNDLVDHLARLFDVSKIAMSIRLINE